MGRQPDFAAIAGEALSDALNEVFGRNGRTGCGPVRSRGLQARSWSRRRGADLLVVGSRGHAGFADALLGSVSTYCVQHAHGPVTICRPDDSAAPPGAALPAAFLRALRRCFLAPARGMPGDFLVARCSSSLLRSSPRRRARFGAARAQRVVHVQPVGGPVGGDRDAVAGQHRVVVHDGQAGRGEADPVAEQRRAAGRPGQVTGLEPVPGHTG